MPDLSFEQNIELSLKLQLSPRLLTMLHVLSLSYVEMLDEIEKASEENPFIEIEKHDTLMDFIHYLDSEKKARKEADFTEYPGLETVKGVVKSLKDFVLDQLNLEELDKKEHDIAAALIDELDSRGYIKGYDELKKRLADEKKASIALVDRMLRVVQGFEPEGVGARDLKECLLIQVREYGFENEMLEDLIKKAIKEHLEDLSAKNYAKVADKLNIGEDGVLQLVDFIKQNLNPDPGANFGGETHHVIPSFSLEINKGKMNLTNLEEKYGPKIVLSKEYQKMLESKKTDAETVKFLREKLEKAKEMLEDLKKRGQTSHAVMSIIVEVQKEFFNKGPAGLMPLMQKELADRLGLHPSTISRAIAGKYVQTPRGLLPVKFLCQREFSGHSKASIKARILEMVADEEKMNPMSDEKIMEALGKEEIKIERRTVASYRKELGILPYEERAAL